MEDEQNRSTDRYAVSAETHITSYFVTPWMTGKNPIVKNVGVVLVLLRQLSQLFRFLFLFTRIMTSLLTLIVLVFLLKVKRLILCGIQLSGMMLIALLLITLFGMLYPAV